MIQIHSKHSHLQNERPVNIVPQSFSSILANNGFPGKSLLQLRDQGDQLT